MADQRDGGIAWTDQTWNPIRGCSRLSEGCRNCYAETMAARFSGPGQPYDGLASSTQNGPRWTGKVRLVDERLADPLRWQRPRRIFVNSMSDLFHESLPDEVIDQVFAVMALAPQHTYQVLTKRAERMAAYFTDREGAIREAAAFLANRSDIAASAAVKMGGRWDPPQIGDFGRVELAGYFGGIRFDWPLPNVWLGVSVEDQAAADKRIPYLLQTPAAVRWLSCEPLLGPVDLHGPTYYPWLAGWTTVPEHDPRCDGSCNAGCPVPVQVPASRIDWVIVGGESGPGARPMHPDWVRSLRDQCKAAGTAFMFKQWGEHAPARIQRLEGGLNHTNGRYHYEFDPKCSGTVRRVGKKAAGRLLDGVLHDEYPAARQAVAHA